MLGTICQLTGAWISGRVCLDGRKCRPAAIRSRRRTAQVRIVCPTRTPDILNRSEPLDVVASTQPVSCAHSVIGRGKSGDESSHEPRVQDTCVGSQNRGQVRRGYRVAPLYLCCTSPQDAARGYEVPLVRINQ